MYSSNHSENDKARQFVDWLSYCSTFLTLTSYSKVVEGMQPKMQKKSYMQRAHEFSTMAMITTAYEKLFFRVGWIQNMQSLIHSKTYLSLSVRVILHIL